MGINAAEYIQGMSGSRKYFRWNVTACREVYRITKYRLLASWSEAFTHMRCNFIESLPTFRGNVVNHAISFCHLQANDTRSGFLNPITVFEVALCATRNTRSGGYFKRILNVHTNSSPKPGSTKRKMKSPRTPLNFDSTETVCRLPVLQLFLDCNLW